MNPDPSAYGVPHEEWRPHQLETVKEIFHGFKLNNKYRIIQAPTGSGKSAIATALTVNDNNSVRVTTHSLNLQRQYADGYGFDAIYGMAHYPCAEWNNTASASNCLYSEAMFSCPSSDICEYLIQRKTVKESHKQILSYAYLLAATWPWDAVTDFIVFDEGHLLPDITKDACSVEYTPDQLYKMDVRRYPTVNISSASMRVSMGVKWLSDVLVFRAKEYNKLLAIPPAVRMRNPTLGKKMRSIASEISRLRRTIAHATDHPEDFYCTWDASRFRLVPMTSRLYFKGLFIRGKTHRPIIMSATIGNPETFARELGLGNNWEFINVPSVFPPESMPVFTFKDAPALGYNTSHNGWQQWGQLIARQIKDLDLSWSGIIHVASAKQAQQLSEMLARHGLEDRLYIPAGKSTNDKIASWQARKQKIPNTLAISYSFFMGLDAYDDQINIIGKVPFATLDEVGRAKLEYDKGIYARDAALLVEQAAGRVRRGVPEHYEVDGEPMRKFVAIADNRYGMVKKEFSSHFQECLTKV